MLRGEILAPVTGDELRDEGIDQVTRNTPEEFRVAFESALGFLIDLGEDFNADDIWPLIEERPHHPNAWGALMNAAVRAKRIVKVGQRKIIRAKGHSRLTGVYRGASSVPKKDYPAGS
jgi:hypothetical protein